MEKSPITASKAPSTASAISYTNNHSVLWAIIHGFFSWLYVIYYVLFK
jgi:hypothetical protein